MGAMYDNNEKIKEMIKMTIYGMIAL